MASNLAVTTRDLDIILDGHTYPTLRSLSSPEDLGPMMDKYLDETETFKVIVVVINLVFL